MTTQKTFSFEFPGSGIKIEIKKVSPYLVSELDKAFPTPEPPQVTVEIDGVKRVETNPADPDYEKALKKHNSEQETRMRKLLIQRGVVCNVDVEAVKELREYMKSTFAVALDPDDKIVYISNLCISNEDDLKSLVRAILSASMPTEEVVEQKLKSFPGPDKGS